MRKKIKNEYINKGEYTELNIIGSIHGDKTVFIDNDDIEKIKEYNWTINKYSKCKKVYYYAVAKGGILLHRYIMNANNGRKTTVDHINNNTLDNRKFNLQICTHEENLRKQKACINNEIGVKGVIWYPYRNINKWMAHIGVNHKRITLGYFNTIEEAIRARKLAEIKYFGEIVNK